MAARSLITDSTRCVLLSGGTGGAKLACGLQRIIGDRLTVIANTGDDVEIYGGYVSPDPDLISFWLAGLINDRGWGIDGDSFTVMEMLRQLGEEIWFTLGDRDLAICLKRAELMRAGATLGDAIEHICKALNIAATVLPMSDQPVRTTFRCGDRLVPFQEFMIKERCELPIDAIEFVGAESAEAAPGVIAAIVDADIVVIGPSNPAISIAPILAVPGVRDALANTKATRVAVSPFVAGEVVKGPTATCLKAISVEASDNGVATYYTDLIDGFICDASVEEIKFLQTNTLMSDADSRRALASAAVEFALHLPSRLHV